MHAPSADPNEKNFSWDTDRIPFLVDKSAIAIISNKHRLFHGHLTTTRVMLETADGVSTKTQLVGVCRLFLTNNTNIHHTYDVPGCVFDPDTPINILGVPDLCTFFGNNVNVISTYGEDGTTIKSGATRFNFIWDQGRHERHFMHGSSLMPDLHLYVGHGYFNEFCTRIHKLLRKKCIMHSHQLTRLTQAPPSLNLISFPQSQKTLRETIIFISGTAQQQ